VMDHVVHHIAGDMANDNVIPRWTNYHMENL
jgi:hypothetical protein